MYRKSLQATTIALLLLFVLSPVVLAAGKGKSMEGKRAGHTIAAKVERVDAPTGLLRLRAKGGETIELAAPEALLEGLQVGDSVEVTIRKKMATQ
jgi:hypothetical protein